MKHWRVKNGGALPQGHDQAPAELSAALITCTIAWMSLQVVVLSIKNRFSRLFVIHIAQVTILKGRMIEEKMAGAGWEGSGRGYVALGGKTAQE